MLIGSYRTADDRWFVLNMLDQARYWEPTCRALGLDALLDDPGLATDETRAARVHELHDMFTARIAALPLADLKARFAAYDTIWSTMASPYGGDRRSASRGQRLFPTGARSPDRAAHFGTRADRRRGPRAFAGAHPRSASTPTRSCARSASTQALSAGCERQVPFHEIARTAARGDLGGGPELPRARGGDRPRRARVPDIVHEVAPLGHRARRTDRRPVARHPTRLRGRARRRHRAPVSRRARS